MEKPMSNTPLPPWREEIQSAARKAALVEDRERWGGDHPPFHYRWEHVQAVVRLALRLAEHTGADREVCEAAAWLHDVAKNGSLDHGRDGATAARHILSGTDFPAEKVDLVADAIGKHVGLSHDEPVEPLEAAVLWDADKLSKLGATVVLHGVGYLLAKKVGETGQLIERLYDEEWAAGIVDNLNTVPARAAGQQRLEAYCAFCRQANREYEGDDLGEQYKRYTDLHADASSDEKAQRRHGEKPL
jgi:uncharacterized protein